MKGITLTREQEVALIEIGMNTLLRNLPLMKDASNPKPRKSFKRKKPEVEAPPKKKRTMSRAARKAISRRMKAYWASQREGK